jgi:quercetin dioxygenase-like cupin family protein
MNTPLPAFDDHVAVMRAQGFDEVAQRQWPPGEIVPTHTHPFAVDVLMVAGEMWLGTGDGEPRHLRPGDRFTLDAHQPHDERYGPEGATYWAARRHA